MSTFTYKKLNLPPVPEYIQQEVKDKFEQYINSVDMTTFVHRGSDEFNDNYGAIDIFEAPASAVQWLKENICCHFESDIIYGPCVQSTCGGDYAPHIDPAPRQLPVTRKWNILFLIETGNATTSFYEPDGELQPLDGATLPLGPFKKVNLKLIDSTQFEQGKWVILNTGIIHGVTTVASRRISLSISIMDDRIPQHIQDSFVN